MPDEPPSTSPEQEYPAGDEPLPLEEVARLFPQYAILGLLGRGASSAVYQALDVAEDRQLAIKIFPLGISEDEPLTTRFAQRAPALVKFLHPHSVAVHFYGLTEVGHLFLVMDYVDGETLRDRIQRGELTPAQALVVLEHVCDALHGAHGHGLMHWGLHPGAVFLDRHGGVKVGDFAAARLALPGEPRSAGIEYLAPEQLQRLHVDHRADIFSIGVMLYEALTGELPGEPFVPASQRVAVNPRIDAVIARAMNPAPDQRYQSSGELLRALAAVRSLVAPAPPASPSPLAAQAHHSARSKSTPIYIGYAAGAAVLVLLGYLAWKPAAKPPVPTVKIKEWPTLPPPGATPVAAATPALAKTTPKPVASPAPVIMAKQTLPVGTWIPVPLNAETIGGATALDGGGIHLTKRVTFDRIQAKDLAVNVTVRLGSEGKEAQLWLRKNSATRAQLQLDGKLGGEKLTCAMRTTRDDSTFRGFGSATVPLTAPGDRWVTLRFAAVGDKLFGVAGERTIKAKDACDVNEPGMIGLNTADADFKDLEVMILDEVAPERYPDFLKAALGIVDAVALGPKTPEAAPEVPAVPKASPEVEKWLVEVDGPFQESYRREVQAPFDAGLEEMFKGYLVSLDRELAAASRAAKLDEALIFRNERQRFGANGQKVPLDDSDHPPALLTTLRVGLRRQVARLERERYERARTLFARYDAVLSQNQAALTQRQRLDDAVRLKARREELAKTWLTPSAGAASATPAPKSTPAPELPKQALRSSSR